MSKKHIIMAVSAVCVLITLALYGDIAGLGIQKYKYYRNYTGEDKVSGDIRANFSTEDINDLRNNQVGDYTITDKYGIKYQFHISDTSKNFEGSGKTVVISYNGSNMPQGRLVTVLGEERSAQKSAEATGEQSTGK